jgi:transaldolase/glucose-6-phosphate isomerase
MLARMTDSNLNGQTWLAPDALASAVRNEIARWQSEGRVSRLWQRDASLWTNQDEAKWLGWLDAIAHQQAAIDRWRALAADVRRERFTHALLLGMGGSSLCPEVWATTFGRQRGYPELHVLDSTSPTQVLAVEGRVDLSRTIVIVASKSGSTLEPNIFKQYFFARMQRAVGVDRAGQHFIAITDPGSKMQKVAEADRFRDIAYGDPSIGGRYSALSPFGIVPAAVMGLDVARLLDEAARMAAACGASTAAPDNPGVVLGAFLGVAATQGRDKLTLIASPGIYDFGAWLEQLIAESTGKDGKAIIPVDLEPLGDPGSYGSDRVFAYLRLEGAADIDQDAGIAALKAAGHPVVQIDVRDAWTLPQEILRWEIATAVAGAALRINTFNQPDVEASKIATRQLTDAYEREGKLPQEQPFATGNGFALFTDKKNETALRGAAKDSTIAAILESHFARVRPGDYVGLLGYIEMNARHAGVLQRIREILRDRLGVATCLGFGPRFLHSTGQAYKGGPNSGVLLQITSDDARDVPIPGQKYSFGTVKAAQARGDFDVLAERGRRVLRVHLGVDVAAGLQDLCDLIDQRVQRGS